MNFINLSLLHSCMKKTQYNLPKKLAIMALALSGLIFKYSASFSLPIKIEHVQEQNTMVQ